MEICAWFLHIMNSAERKALSRDDLESFLIEIDVGLIDHASFHLKSMKKEIETALAPLARADDDDKGDELRGAA